MDFLKKSLKEVNTNENTLYDFIYNLFFLAKIKESEDDIIDNKTCNLEELKRHIDGLEAKYENNNIQ